MFNWFDDLIFNIKFWFKIRKLRKLDPQNFMTGGIFEK